MPRGNVVAGTGGAVQAGDHTSGTRRVFISYARKDLDVVQRLRTGLERLRLDVWVDVRLSVGQEWWAVILEQIRICDAMIVAVSPALLESTASAVEREYGRRLGKVILPVCVRAVRTEFLPDDLGRLQIVDYRSPGPEAAFELADALANLPRSPALPQPLPEPPGIPPSYLSDVANRVYGATLTLDDQLSMVGRLRTALARDTERDAALELLGLMQRRDDLYHVPAREIEDLLAVRTKATDSAPSAEVPERQNRVQQPYIPPGWYPDPSARHQLRWFDQDWTEWASDGGSVIEDRL